MGLQTVLIGLKSLPTTFINAISSHIGNNTREYAYFFA